jgi:hypothetical protein
MIELVEKLTRRSRSAETLGKLDKTLAPLPRSQPLLLRVRVRICTDWKNLLVKLCVQDGCPPSRQGASSTSADLVTAPAAPPPAPYARTHAGIEARTRAAAGALVIRCQTKDDCGCGCRPKLKNPAPVTPSPCTRRRRRERAGRRGAGTGIGAVVARVCVATICVGADVPVSP